MLHQGLVGVLLTELTLFEPSDTALELNALPVQPREGCESPKQGLSLLADAGQPALGQDLVYCFPVFPPVLRGNFTSFFHGGGTEGMAIDPAINDSELPSAREQFCGDCRHASIQANMIAVVKW